MSFEFGFLLACVGILVVFIVALTVSTLLVGSRRLLRFQHMMNSLKYNKEVDALLDHLLAKEEAGLLIPRIKNNVIQLYTPDAYAQKNSTDYYEQRSAKCTEIWIGNKFTQYGYIEEHDGNSYKYSGKCGSYSTFRRILALEDRLTGRTKSPEPKAPTEKKAKENLEVELS